MAGFLCIDFGSVTIMKTAIANSLLVKFLINQIKREGNLHYVYIFAY